MQKTQTIQPLSLKNFVNRFVVLKIEGDIEIRGFLVGSDNGQHGGLGNVFVNIENGTTLVRGSTIQCVALLGGK